MPWYFFVSKFLVKLFFIVFTRWKVKGEENIPGQGPVLIVANHLTNADPPLLCVSLNREVRFMAKEELFRNKFASYFLTGYGCFPVQRGRLDRKSLRQAEKFLADGLALVMFPEGMRSRSRQLRPALPGSALLAWRSGALILPVGIFGTEQMKGRSWFLRRPRVTVNVGKTFQLPATTSKSSRKELTNYIMEHIAELLPPQYQGVYAKQGN